MHQLYHTCGHRLYQFYLRYKNSEWCLLAPIVVVTVTKIIMHFFWLVSSGRGLPQADDSKWYLRYAGSLLENLTDGLDVNDVLYFGYNLLLTLLMSIFKDPLTIILIQGIAAGFSVIFVYKIALLLFNRRTAVIAALFYCGSYEITLWSLYILSDSFFVSLLIAGVYLLLQAMETRSKRHGLLFLATAAYILVFRPTGIMAISFMAAYVLVRIGKDSIAAFLLRHRKAIGVLVVSGLAASLYLYLGHKFDGIITSAQYEAKKVLYNVYAKGWIYDKPTAFDYFYRPNYKIDVADSLVLSFIVNNWEHVVVVYGRRALAFLGTWVWMEDMKTSVSLMKCAGNLIPTALFVGGTIEAVRNGLFRKASILWLLTGGVFMFCILLFIDAMYRYKYPAIPFIIIVAAYGTERLLATTLAYAKNIRGCGWIYEKGKDTDCNPGL